MNHLRWIVIGVGLCLTVSAMAERPQLRTYLEYIEVPKATFEALLKKRDTKVGSLHGDLRALVKARKARIHESVIVTGNSGQRMSLGSVQELIYPTEMDDNSSGPFNPSVRAPVRPGPKEARLQTPLAFETREVGADLEIEPTLSKDGKVIAFKIEAGILDYLRLKEWFREEDQFGESVTGMPVFQRLKLEQSVALSPGSFQVLGSLAPQEQKKDEPVQLVVCVKIDVLPPIVAVPKPETEKGK